MAGIMDMFSVKLDEFVKDYDDLHWDVSFRGEEYPSCHWEPRAPRRYGSVRL